MIKRAFATILCVMAVFSLSASSFAANGDFFAGNWETDVKIDGGSIITRVSVDKDGEIYIKLREFLEYLGYTVSWNASQRAVISQKEGERLIIWIDKNRCDKNGSLMYVKTPVRIEQDYSYLPLSFLKNIMGIETELIDRAEPPSSRINGLELKTAAVNFNELQQSADEGKSPLCLDPVATAREFAAEVLHVKGDMALAGTPSKDSARVLLTLESGGLIPIDLYHPAKKGEGGIWVVESWYDKSSRQYQARDLSRLPALFHNESGLEAGEKETIRQRIVSEWTKAYEKYYEVLGFESSGLSVSRGENSLEIKFIFSMVTKNFYKDPDTVQYIKEAKANGSVAYDRLREEYNLARVINLDLKVIAGLNADGSINPSDIKILANLSPTGEDYQPVSAGDFIAK